MSGSWIDVDWSVSRPTQEQVDVSYKGLTFTQVELGGAATKAVVAQLKSLHRKGGATLSAFRVDHDDATLRWFISRNRFTEYDLFGQLLSSEAFSDALPEAVALSPDQATRNLERWHTGAYTLDGWIASVLKRGGAHARYEGSGADAKKIGIAFVDEVVAGRYEDFSVHETSAPWNPWFRGLVWDVTLIALDKAARLIILLMLTDSD